MSATEEKLQDKVNYLGEQSKRLFLEKENLVRSATEVNKKLMGKTNELDIVKTAAKNRIAQADKEIKSLNDKLSKMHEYCLEVVKLAHFQPGRHEIIVNAINEIRGPVIN